MTGNCAHDHGSHLHGTMTICNICGASTGITTVAFGRLALDHGDRLVFLHCGTGWDVALADPPEDRITDVALGHGETQAEALRQVAEWCEVEHE